MGPAGKTVLFAPASGKINRIEQKVKKKSDGVIALYYEQI
jgi:gas vesicle protein